ncbi:MAG TPA: arsenate reductase ArsC [Humisphaera sp.]|jgi:arsenate reductase|nr:arsenate reductase ArsC [Humisphaera sp.]
MQVGKPIVLILCTGNSCRSQMAEGFLRAYQGDKYEPHSAGTDPKDQVHPLAVQVMTEAGIDITSQKPKSLGTYLGHAPVRHLIIVCDKANGSCPRIWPGAYTRGYIPFDDPATFEGTPEQTLAEFRRVRDLIGQTMKTWKPEVERPTGASTPSR